MDDDIYEKVGGRQGIIKLVDALYVRVIEDPRVQNRVSALAESTAKDYLVSFTESLITKNSAFEGPAPREVSSGQGLTKHEVTVFLSHLDLVCSALGLTLTTANSIVSLFTSLRGEVEDR